MFSAYDIKKILPRAAFALVGISLSWALMNILVNFMGFLGDSIEKIILDSFTTASSRLTSIQLDTSSSGWFMALASAAIIGSVLGLLPVLGLAIAGATGVGLAFIIILLRRVALVALVISAPLAIAMSVLPQTEKVFKEWWEWFFKLLLMYPFLMAMFAFSRVAAGLFSLTGDSGGTNVLYQFAAIAILIAPYFLVGKAFSFAGGSIAKLAGVVNNKDRGLIDKTKKWEAGKVAERRIDAKAGSRYGGRNAFTRGINRTLRDIALAPKTAFRGQDRKNAEYLAANQKAAAALEEVRPGIKGATKDELRMGMLAPNKKAAKDAIERLVAEAPDADKAATRARWEAALAGWESKVGSLDTASATYALGKGVEAGLGSPAEIQASTSLIGQNLGHSGVIRPSGEQDSVSATISAGLEPAYKASGNAFGFAPTTKNDGEFGDLKPSEQAATVGAVTAIFDGDKAMSYKALGEVKADSAATIRTVKRREVEHIITDLASGAITPEQAQDQIAKHRQDALLLSNAIASGESKDAGAANEAASLVADIDSFIESHNNSVGSSGGPTIDNFKVEYESLQGARSRAKPL